MGSDSPSPDLREVRGAIVRYALHDLQLVAVMWLVPLIFLWLNPWVRHWSTLLVLVAIGTFVVGGTTLSLPGTTIRSFPPGHSSIWTPLRCFIFVVFYLILWSLTYVAVEHLANAPNSPRTSEVLAHSWPLSRADVGAGTKGGCAGIMPCVWCSVERLRGRSGSAQTPFSSSRSFVMFRCVVQNLLLQFGGRSIT